MSLTKEIKFWSEDISVLFNADYMLEFFPTKSQTMIQKLNAVTRLSLYIVTLLTLQTESFDYIKYLVYVLIGTYAVYHFNTKERTKESVFKPTELAQTPAEVKKTDLKNPSKPYNAVIESLENVNQNCVKPTLNNPFMNVTYVDQLDNPNREEACDISDPEIKKDIEDKFMNNLFRDVNDLFGKNNSQRQFYTMPSTTVANKQDEFARWLYLSPKTCKEDQDYCIKYEDLRQNRPVMVNPYENPVNTKRLEKQE